MNPRLKNCAKIVLQACFALGFRNRGLKANKIPIFHISLFCCASETKRATIPIMAPESPYRESGTDGFRVKRKQALKFLPRR